MSKGLRTTFLIHVFVALAFGVVMYLVPATWADMTKWTPLDENITRIFGAALTAIGVSSWLEYRATKWDEVRIILVLEIVFTVLGGLGSLYGALALSAPVFIWVPFSVFLVFGFLFAYFYARGEVPREEAPHSG